MRGAIPKTHAHADPFGVGTLIGLVVKGKLKGDTIISVVRFLKHTRTRTPISGWYPCWLILLKGN